MGIDWSLFTFGKGQPAMLERRTRKLDKAKLLAEAYAEVDRLDQGICWVTGRTTSPASSDAKTAREHHHLAGRRVRPEWRHDPARIITVCREAHQLITLGKIDVEGLHRKRALFFHWNLAPKYRPFEIQPKRVRARKVA